MILIFHNNKTKTNKKKKNACYIYYSIASAYVLNNEDINPFKLKFMMKFAYYFIIFIF